MSQRWSAFLIKQWNADHANQLTNQLIIVAMMAVAMAATHAMMVTTMAVAMAAVVKVIAAERSRSSLFHKFYMLPRYENLMCL